MRALDMSLIARAALAWNRRDWDALWNLMIPLVPSLKDDGTGHTPTGPRRVFTRLLPTMGFPAPLERAAAQYLAQATDGQLRQIAEVIDGLAHALKTADDRPPLALVADGG